MERGSCVRFDLIPLKAEPQLQILQVNLTTVFTLCRDVGAHMLRQGPNTAGHRGSIINVASLLSFQWVTPACHLFIRTEMRGPGLQIRSVGAGNIVSESIVF